MLNLKKQKKVQKKIRKTVETTDGKMVNKRWKKIMYKKQIIMKLNEKYAENTILILEQ